jgi:hypothetical protein
VVATGTVVRIAAMVAIASIVPETFGTDEQVFLQEARELTQQPLVTALGDISPLHVWLFSLELRVDLPEIGMRIIQVGIAIAGVTLLATSVYDVAGPRAARITAWLLVFEPAGAFFGALLHKEALMTASTGLVIFAGVRFWKRYEARAVVWLTIGCTLAAATRPYAGAVLFAGAGALVVHRCLRGEGARARRVLLALFATLALIALGAALERGSQGSLARLQTSQEANATDGSNLALEPVEYTTPLDFVVNLPGRCLDILLRPYPWELSGTNGLLGLPGALTAVATLAILLLMLPENRRRILRHTAPFIYPALSLLAAYAVTSGNAGTSFRHRAQLVALGICVVMVLREHRSGRVPASERSRHPGAPRRPRSVRMGEGDVGAHGFRART